MKKHACYAVLLAALLPAHASIAQEKSPKFELVGISQDADIQTAAIVIFDQKPGENPHFRCNMKGVSHTSLDLNLVLKGQSKVAAMLPGEYDVSANYVDGDDGGVVMGSTIRLEAGRQYRVTCVRKRYRNIKIEIVDTTATR